MRMSDEASTLCALVNAKTEEAAKAAVVKDWPEATQWRFCEQKPDNFELGDRFPVTREWEKQRMASMPKDETTNVLTEGP